MRPNTFQNPPALRTGQYATSVNLNARANLHINYSTAEIPWFSWYFDQIDLPDRVDMLEIGCGPGHFWRENADRIPTSRYVLTDLSTGMVTETREHISSLGDFRFAVTDARRRPFPDNAFNVVMANHMLYHVPDRPAALSEIHRVLKPGGRFYAATNGNNHMLELREAIVRIDPALEDGFESGEFGLDTGADQLMPFFENVTCSRFDCDLEAPLIAPVLGYVESAKRLDEDQLAQLAQELAAWLDRDGVIRIQKNAGFFVCTKRG